MRERPRGVPIREAHGHLGMLGESLTQPSLAHCTGLRECLDSIAAAAASAKPGAWVLVRGARIEGWDEARWPTLEEIDGATAGVPTVVMSFDHHVGVANSAAMAAAGLRPGERVAPNGVVESDGAGRATGVLVEAAVIAAWNAAPEVGFAERVEQLAAGAAHLAGLGFAEVHDLHSPPWMGPGLANLERAGRLPLRVRLYPAFGRIEEEAARSGAYESGRVHLGGGKLFADGTLNTQTALMLEAYAGGSNKGVAMHTAQEIERAIARCDAVGKHLAVHAIGDGAVRMTLDCFERVRPRTPGGRIEHCELIDPADVGRFVRLGVACSVQPCHLLADVEVIRRTLGHRESRVLPLADLLASGLEPGNAERGLVFGSDVPIVRADPGDSVLAAVTRGREGAPTAEAINAGQAIGEGDAWRCFACTG